MTPVRRIRLGLISLGIVIVVGTIGYVVIEGADLFDSFYMVIITITTVGFGEVFDLSTVGRAWTMIILIGGFGFVFYTAIAEIDYLIVLREARRQNQMMKSIEGLSGHVIVCGYGRVGRATNAALRHSGTQVVVIDQDEERVERAQDAGVLVVRGDATHNDTLSQAGIDRASALIACVNTDSDNLVIALSAKSIRPELRVICRATEIESERKLLLAGADGVVTPQAVGAERLAALAIQPELAQIFDVIIGGKPVEFMVEELDVKPGCRVDGRSIKESGIRQETGAMILAVEDQKVAMQVNPGPELVLSGGDRLVVVGTKEQVDKAAQMLG